MKNIVCNYIFLTVLIQTTYAQQVIHTVPAQCGTTKYYDQLFTTSPKLKEKFEHGQQIFNSVDKGLTQKAKDVQNKKILNDTIPVVLHVVASPAVQALVTDALLQSQVDVLNEDFRGLNLDTTRIPPAFKQRFGKGNFVFKLAGTNEYGEPATGVVRKETETKYTLNSADNAKQTSLGGSDAWDPSQYVNIWVVNFETTQFLGLSVFPRDPRPVAVHGLVCDYRAFGRNASHLLPKFNRGRTATHEMGHFFNLRHIWGDDGGSCGGTDFPNTPGLDDTPNQSDATLGNPDPLGSGVIKTDACSPAAPGIMYQNFLDLTDDAGMVLFTKGQHARMENVLSVSPDRSPVLNSTTYQTATVRSLDAWIRQITTPTLISNQCSNIINPVVTLRNSGTGRLSTVQIVLQLDNEVPIVYNWAGSLSSYTETNVSLPAFTIANGTHTLKIYTQHPNATVDENPANDTATLSFVTGAVQGPLIESFEGPIFPPSGWSVINTDNNTTWKRMQGISHSGKASAGINLWNYSLKGQRDKLRTPNLKINTTDSLLLNFWIAHARAESLNDSLIINVSTDCGNSWTRVYQKGSNTLKTTKAETDFDNSFGFTPMPYEWRKEIINLSAFNTTGEIMVEFEAFNNYGDNIFIDDVTLGVARDAALVRIDNPNFRNCTANEKPVVTIQNLGSTTITSLNVNYKIDEGPIATFNWSGHLATNAFENIVLPNINLGIEGSHIIKISLSNLNASSDQYNANDTLVKKYTVVAPIPLPDRVVEEFTSTQFPPAKWDVDNPDNDLTWEHHPVVGYNRPGSAWFNERNNETNSRFDDLYMPSYSYSGVDSIFLHFNVAAALYKHTSRDIPTDTLTVLVTKDCGNTFSTVYKKWGSELQTIRTPEANEFFPQSKSQWRRDSLNLGEYLSSSESQFSVVFRFGGNYGNNIFIDDVALFTKRVPVILKEKGYLIFPTVAKGHFTVWHYQQPITMRYIAVYNSTGELIWKNEYNGNANKYITIDLTKNPNGLYIVKIGYSNNQNFTERVIKQ